MATKRKPWPRAAQQQRDEAAYHAAMALKQLKPLLQMDHKRFTRSDLFQRLGISINEIQTTLRWLERAGAPVKLEE